MTESSRVRLNTDTLKDYLRPMVREFTHRIGQNSLLRGLLRNMSLRGVLPSAIWKRILVEAEFDVHLSPRQQFRYYCTYGDLIGQTLFWRGLWHSVEAQEIQVFLRLAREANFVVDVGANTGLYALVACAANSRSKVMAFEPAPVVQENLVRNVQINDWGSRIEIRTEAVANYEGVAQFHLERQEWGYQLPKSYKSSTNMNIIPTMSTLNPDGFRARWTDAIDVKVTTLDSGCAKWPRVDLVKIDVEGSEHLALEGGQGILKEFAPAILVEALHDGPLEAISDILSGHGYRYFDFGPNSLIPLRSIDADPSRHLRNVLCIKQPEHLRLVGLDPLP
jgi:FkbM family methyltransferase